MKGFLRFLGIVSTILGIIAVADRFLNKKETGGQYLNLSDNSAQKAENYEN